MKPKDKKQERRLTLHRETLRSLAEAELADAAGGRPYISIPANNCDTGVSRVVACTDLDCLTRRC